MSVKSERVTILTTPDFKAFLNAEAAAQGVSVSELIRARCTVAPSDSDDDAMLAAMVDQVNKSTVKADKSLAKGLKDITKALNDIRKGKK